LTLLRAWGVSVKDDASTEWLDAELAKGKPATRIEVGSENNKRTADILTIAEKCGVSIADAKRAIAEGKSVEDFQRQILESRYKVTQVELQPSLGMGEKEVREYSVIRAIQGFATGKFDGIEREASNAFAKLVKRDAEGFWIPSDVSYFKRDLSANVGNKGG